MPRSVPPGMVDDGWRGRRAARVVLIDAAKRVLLLRASDPSRPEKGIWWEIPGGGQDPGETSEVAAALHRGALIMAPSGFVAVIAGWVTTEVGRQPWTIYGLMRTAESASPLDAPAVGASLLAFIVVYFAVFGVGTWYILRLMNKTPHAGETPVEDAPIRTAGITPGPTQNPGGGRRLPEGGDERGEEG